MEKRDLIKKIIQKKEFSQLPPEDVERAFKKFDNENYLDEGMAFLPYKFIDDSDEECIFRYSVTDNIYGTSSYFHTEKI